MIAIGRKTDYLAVLPALITTVVYPITVNQPYHCESVIANGSKTDYLAALPVSITTAVNFIIVSQ